ncbi:hypothetical protein [Streptomyces sp. rh34]|uniref:hypothetical protein n=1 Tax=Streptomyces sp. rh34 TaxID=2034272 RepID=UPI000BF1C08C|nr:hypothetical protein [Streptomyces sp. rh34]
MAQVHAAGAWYSADEARKSAIAAGKDAAAAITASTEAFVIAVTKKRQEEEARRKAAVEEKERNEDGLRARQLYRCGQGIIPCDPYEYVRWCRQSPVNRQILEHGREIGDALDKSMDVTKEFIGLGELEACLQNKDFSSCATLVGEVLVGAKVKALKKSYDALKLLKRGCKIASRSALRTASASSADLPCGTHNIPGLPRDKSKITSGPGDCQACAERIRDNLGDGKIVWFGPAGPYFGKYREQDTDFWNNSYHVVVVLNGRVYDAFTPKAGESIPEYKSRWQYGDIIDFGF